MKLSLQRNGETVEQRVWRSIDPCVRFALLGLGLVRIDEETGRPVIDELPAEMLAKVERACGVRL